MWLISDKKKCIGFPFPARFPNYKRYTANSDDYFNGFAKPAELHGLSIPRRMDLIQY